jgi:predicted DNA-binding protein
MFNFNMARLNISLSNELARKITDESEKLGKTISSLITEATSHYIDLKEQGLDMNELNDFLMYFRIITSTRSVPVPFRLFDDILAISMGDSKEDTGKLFYETGLVVGSLIKNYAPDMESLSRLSEKLKFRLPLDDIRISGSPENWEATISGAGYGQSSSRCLAEGLRGFVESYGLEIKSLEVIPGFVKAKFR